MLAMKYFCVTRVHVNVLVYNFVSATNRRRIYDIINVMEALEMISKQSKNWYLWHGRGNLTTTLAKFKVQ